MTANRWITASLTAVTAVLSVCLYAGVAAPAVSEEAGIGPPPALAPGQAPPLPKAGPLRSRGHKIKSAFPRR
jgi:cytochrome c peroxidase